MIRHTLVGRESRIRPIIPRFHYSIVPPSRPAGTGRGRRAICQNKANLPGAKVMLSPACERGYEKGCGLGRCEKQSQFGLACGLGQARAGHVWIPASAGMTASGPAVVCGCLGLELCVSVVRRSGWRGLDGAGGGRYCGGARGIGQGNAKS